MPGKSPDELQAEIDAQREELAHTVDELAARLDVKSRATARAADLKDRATTDAGKPRPEVLAAAASLIAMTAVLIVWRVRQGGK
ncbi:DUF3618 domain-containing protein [Nocardioides coralli]|uniref:DUF3618 domain-containing protein n=1 Tax=Nocardioides coralli TaxID=2872154 RepID=UPI001CA38E96|nr:DUF3618 domain-containing protein [Nocardioides coralli]QZY30296.1 DUF3618 domain-containing protein [Nocardioides coralli]